MLARKAYNGHNRFTPSQLTACTFYCLGKVLGMSVAYILQNIICEFAAASGDYVLGIRRMLERRRAFSRCPRHQVPPGVHFQLGQPVFLGTHVSKFDNQLKFFLACTSPSSTIYFCCRSRSNLFFFSRLRVRRSMFFLSSRLRVLQPIFLARMPPTNSTTSSS